MKNILVVAVHPDDETLGCGGTLLKHKKNQENIHWLIVTEMKEEEGFSKDEIETRQLEIKKVTEKYNFTSVHQLGLSTMKVDEYTMSELISKISTVINSIKPDTIYLPFKGDVHSDHRKIFEASYSCTKSFRYPFIKKLYMIETLSETEFAPSTKEDSFIPNIFVDITDEIEEKLDIIKIFKSELQPHPFPRSIESIKALAILRGSTCGVNYAESFMLLKEIIK